MDNDSQVRLNGVGPQSTRPKAVSRAPMRALPVVFMGAVTLALLRPVRAQAPAASPTAAPTNANWCPGVPESPPPPRWPAGEWSGIYKWCSRLGLSHSQWVGCRRACGGARGAWTTSKNPPPKQKYLSTNRPQGPIPLPGGGEGYILPLPPTPPPATLQMRPRTRLTHQGRFQATLVRT